MKKSPYFAQSELIVKLLPIIFRERCYALKGGTAINFFVRNLPRLSVDIDLVYLPVQDRSTTVHEIKASLKRCADRILLEFPGAKVQSTAEQKEAGMKLVVRHGNATVKIEPNFIFRGSVFPAKELELSPAAQKIFGLFAAVPVVSIPDLYGGGIVRRS